MTPKRLLSTSFVLAIVVVGCGGDVATTSGAKAGGSGGALGAAGSSTNSPGGAGGAGASVIVGAAGAGGVITSPCPGATPILNADGADTGFVTCENGGIDRVLPVTLPVASDRHACGATDTPEPCQADSDCTDSPNGRCGVDPGGSHCTCTYDCTNDADCADGYACVPLGVSASIQASQCVRAGCRTSADCTATGECSLEGWGSDRCVLKQLLCRQPTDPCRTSADCKQTGECAADGGPWICGFFDCF